MMTCWPVQEAQGASVTLQRTMRRRSCARTTNTYSARKVAVGTTKKSIAAARGRWLARNVPQVCEGGGNRRGMRRDTVASLTTKPSLRSSPWMRGAPQPTLSRAISRMRVRISASVRGRPPRLRLVHLQYRANPLRCQRITVAGLHDHQGRPPLGPHPRQHDPARAIRPAELGTLRLASQDGQLLSQSQILQRQLAARPEARPRR